MQLRSSMAVFTLVLCCIASFIFGWKLYRNRLSCELIMATGRGNRPRTLALLHRGADINHVDRLQTPLLAAIEGHHPDLVQLLLRKGANPHHAQLVDALTYAASVGDKSSFKIIFDQERPHNLAPLLGVAMRGGNSAVVTFLLQKHIDANAVIDADRETALFVAATPDVTRLLLDHGADHKRKASNGNTPLHTVHDAEVAALLISYGALVNEKNAEGQTPVYVAAKQGDTQRVSLLLQHGADVTAGDAYKLTPLHVCANNEVAELLMQHGARINSRNIKLKTPLHVAVRNGNGEMVRYLLRHGAEVNARDIFGETPLHELAFYYSVPSAMDELFTAGADIDARNKRGETVLMKAVTWRRADVVQYLIRHGANICLADNSGRTPLDRAKCEGNQHIVDLLVQAGKKQNKAARRSW